MSYNFTEIHKIRNKIFWSSLKYSLPKLIVNFIAYFGSLVTIFSIKFIINGKFSFKITEFIDWFLIVCLIILMILGFIDTRKEILKNFQSKIIVSRQQLLDIIASFRKDAVYSISNLSGDISWLRDDYEITKALRSLKPNLKIEIFYDRGKVSPETIELFKQYEDLSAKFISYPSILSPHTKSVLIDKEDKEKAVLLSFKKLQSNFFLSFNKNDLFEITVQKDYDTIEISSTIALVKALDYINTNLVVVGISGVNNVGKTTITNLLKYKLEEQVSIIPDCFQEPMESNTENAIISILMQTNEYIKYNKKSRIIIFDRTPLDNYAYFRLRNHNSDNVELKNKVLEIMKRFDIIIDLKKKDESYKTKTTRVLGSERKIVRKYLSDSFKENNFHRIKIELDHTKKDDAIEKSIYIYEEIMKIQKLKNLK